MNKEQSIEESIAAETALIKKLEAEPWPVANSTEYHIRKQELGDAYWRRRNLKRRGLA
jgi:hypothetical protein